MRRLKINRRPVVLASVGSAPRELPEPTAASVPPPVATASPDWFATIQGYAPDEVGLIASQARLIANEELSIMSFHAFVLGPDALSSFEVAGERSLLPATVARIQALPQFRSPFRNRIGRGPFTAMVLDADHYAIELYCADRIGLVADYLEFLAITIGSLSEVRGHQYRECDDRMYFRLRAVAIVPRGTNLSRVKAALNSFDATHGCSSFGPLKQDPANPWPTESWVRGPARRC